MAILIPSTHTIEELFHISSSVPHHFEMLKVEIKNLNFQSHLHSFIIFELDEDMGSWSKNWVFACGFSLT